MHPLQRDSDLILQNQEFIKCKSVSLQKSVTLWHILPISLFKFSLYVFEFLKPRIHQIQKSWNHITILSKTSYSFFIILYHHKSKFLNTRYGKISKFSQILATNNYFSLIGVALAKKANAGHKPSCKAGHKTGRLAGCTAGCMAGCMAERKVIFNAWSLWLP